MNLQTLVIGHIETNCYILTDSKSGDTAVIDPCWLTDELKAAVDCAGGVKYILLTHGHFDHICGVHDLREYTGAEVAIHESDADCLFDEKKSLADGSGYPFKPVRADIILRDGDVLELGGKEIKVMHTPGHTKGGVCFICESDRMIFSGDTLFHSTVGRTDFEGGSFKEIIESVERLQSLDGDYDVYPGHNRSTTLERERTRNFYMRRQSRRQGSI